ncbi:uncharacterized protein LOC105030058 isoform X1 [Esox lucius]|uniref:uncharacterized protein LOC105030058 isoform X1 n=1 Tax=Esox lucius TaxID=8010 RepID=UPI0014768AD5|nr:uncharacterized protein LOC105030058 isoform X1 [Esox lucius]XP_019897518.2 uncharacterized protein LOC105030058 isoform X1 [Esox lucius]
MEGNVSTAHQAFGMGPCGPNPSPAHGPQPGQGPRNPGHPGSYGAPHPEDQSSLPQPPHHHQNQQQPHHHIQHSRPFFYVQPSQLYPPPSLTYPWPMPVPYNPYCGYPGLGGYGMMMPNPFQPSTYVEHPGYVLAHSQLHLADYRRMTNPHYHASHHPQAMAYHARRFRYQHSATHAREMINSEVQTDSLPGAVCSDSQLSKLTESSPISGVQTNSEFGKSSSCAQPLSTVAAGEEVISKSAGCQDVVSPTPNPVNARSTASQKGSFLFQAEMEEVRIECCSTLTGLKIRKSQSQETGELAAAATTTTTTTTTTTQCVSHSMSGADGEVKLRPQSSLHPLEQSSNHREAHGRSLEGEGLRPCLAEVQEEQCGQACPNLLQVGRSPSAETSPAIVNMSPGQPGTSRPDMDHRLVVQTHGTDSPQLARSDGQEVSMNMQYLEELRKMEVSLWSAESLAPYVPSSELMIRQGLMSLHRQTLSPVVEVPLAEEGPVVQEVPVTLQVPGAQEVLTPEEGFPKAVQGPVVEEVLTAEVPMNEVVPTAEVIPMMEEPLSAIYSPNMDALTSPESSKRGAASDLDHQDTFEVLPTYLPSASWLADLGNVYYYSKLPRSVEEQPQILRISPLKPLSPKVNTNLQQEPKDPCATLTTALGIKGEGCSLRQKVDRKSYSDHECSANRTVNQNTLTPGGQKRNRICARCLTTTKCRAKKRTDSPGSDVPVVKRQGVLIPPWEESVLAQTCAACKSLPRRQVMRKRSRSDAPGGYNEETSDGETSENSSFWARPGAPKLRGSKDLKRPLDSRSQSSMKSHSEKCPVALQSKLREKNCSCQVPHLRHGPMTATWEGQSRSRRHSHSNSIREQNEENLGVAVSVHLQDKCRNQDGLLDRRYLTEKKLQQGNRMFEPLATFPTERLWRADTSASDNILSNRNIPRPRSLNPQTQHVSQAQGMNRKDTRC